MEYDLKKKKKKKYKHLSPTPPLPFPYSHLSLLVLPIQCRQNVRYVTDTSPNESIHSVEKDRSGIGMMKTSSLSTCERLRRRNTSPKHPREQIKSLKAVTNECERGHGDHASPYIKRPPPLSSLKIGNWDITIPTNITIRSVTRVTCNSNHKLFRGGLLES